MMIIKIFLIFQLMISYSALAAKPKKETINLIIGIPHTEILDFVPHTQVTISEASRLRYVIAPQKKRITFNGIKPGPVTAHILDLGGDIRKEIIFNVTATDQSKILQKLTAYLGDIEGLEIGIKGEKVYVGGEIVVPNDIGKVVVVLDEMGEGVLRLVELSPQTQRIVAQKMQEEIHRQGKPTVNVRIVNGLYWLEGVVGSKEDKERAFRIAEAFLPDKLASLSRNIVDRVEKSLIQDFIHVNEKAPPKEIPKLIKITAQFVELTKDYMKTFGFKWGPTLSTGGQIEFGKTTTNGVTTKSSGTLSGVIANLFPKLASAKNAGHARVIQSGVILVKNNVQGKISKNSSKPYSIGTGDFTKSSTAQAGFDVTVTPTILEGENIELKAGISVSSNIGEPPETLTNSISTTVIIKSKESAVVGGVVINKSSTAYDKDPPYGKDVIDAEDSGSSTLFSFLRSKSYLTSKSQFVIFLTPEVVESASEGTSEVKRKFRKRGR